MCPNPERWIKYIIALLIGIKILLGSGSMALFGIYMAICACCWFFIGGTCYICGIGPFPMPSRYELLKEHFRQKSIQEIEDEAEFMCRIRDIYQDMQENGVADENLELVQGWPPKFRKKRRWFGGKNQ